jgi:hypothetical protein
LETTEEVQLHYIFFPVCHESIEKYLWWFFIIHRLLIESRTHVMMLFKSLLLKYTWYDCVVHYIFHFFLSFLPVCHESVEKYLWWFFIIHRLLIESRTHVMMLFKSLLLKYTRYDCVVHYLCNYISHLLRF